MVAYHNAAIAVFAAPDTELNRRVRSGYYVQIIASRYWRAEQADGPGAEKLTAGADLIKLRHSKMPPPQAAKIHLCAFQPIRAALFSHAGTMPVRAGAGKQRL